MVAPRRRSLASSSSRSRLRFGTPFASNDSTPSSMARATARSFPSRDQRAEHLALDAREPDAVARVVVEGFPDVRHPLGDDRLANQRGIGANLRLRMRIHSERQKAEQVVQVHLPVGLGIGGERQVLPRLLARDALVDPGLVGGRGQCVELGFGGRERRSDIRREESFAALTVAAGLPAPVGRQR